MVGTKPTGKSKPEPASRSGEWLFQKKRLPDEVHGFARKIERDGIGHARFYGWKTTRSSITTPNTTGTSGMTRIT